MENDSGLPGDVAFFFVPARKIPGTWSPCDLETQNKGYFGAGI